MMCGRIGMLIRVGLAGVLVAALVVMSGCGGGDGGGGGGGGNGGPSPVVGTGGTVTVFFSVFWPARSGYYGGSDALPAQVDAPSSALSLKVQMSNDRGWSPDPLVWNRLGGSDYLGPHCRECRFPGVPVGPVSVIATFWSGRKATGDLVGIAEARVEVGEDGSGLNDLAVEGHVASVEVPAGQWLNVGEDKRLACHVISTTGAQLAVTPGCIFWRVVEGHDCLDFTQSTDSAGRRDWRAHGVKDGSALVVATVDGVASAPCGVIVGRGPLEPAKLMLQTHFVKLMCGESRDIGVVLSDGTTPPLEEFSCSVLHADKVTVETPEQSGKPRIRLKADAHIPGSATVRIEGVGPLAGQSDEVKVEVFSNKIINLYDPRRPPGDEGDPIAQLTFVEKVYSHDGAKRDNVGWEQGSYEFTINSTEGLPDSGSWYVFGSTIRPYGEKAEQLMRASHTCLAIRPVPGAEMSDGRPPVIQARAFDKCYIDQDSQDGGEDAPDNVMVFEPWDANYPDYKPLGYLALPCMWGGYDRTQLWDYWNNEYWVPWESRSGKKGITQLFPNTRAPRPGKVALVHPDLVAEGILTDRVAMTNSERTGVKEDADFAHWYRVFAPPWRGAMTAYIPPDTMVIGTTPSRGQPAKKPACYVLKARLPADRQDEPRLYSPQLDRFHPPPEYGPDLMGYVAFAPFTMLSPRAIGAYAQDFRENSPFIRVERIINYRCIEHCYNPTSEMQHGMVISTTTGVEKTESDTFKADFGMSMTYEWGVEVGYEAGGFNSTAHSNMSLSFSMHLGYETTRSVKELRHQTKSFQLNVPPQTAVAFFQRYDRLRLRAADGRILGELAYGGGENYAYAQYPPPEDIAAALSWVPAGVDVLTPWTDTVQGRWPAVVGRSNSGRSAARQRVAPAPSAARPAGRAPAAARPAKQAAGARSQSAAGAGSGGAKAGKRKSR